MHVRVAWEIYYHQQKQASEKNSAGNKIPGSEMLRPPTGLPHAASPSMFSSLPRPPNLLPPTMLPGAGPSHRFESSNMMSQSHLTPSIPGLGGLRYPGNSPGGPNPGPHHMNSSFHHPGVTPTAISGPPPGSMFSRENFTSVGLNYPNPSPAHDPWRLVFLVQIVYYDFIICMKYYYNYNRALLKASR